MEDTSQYTVDQAAQILELSPACVRQMLRAGELEGERREERIEGVLGPWRIPERAVHALREGDPDVLRAKRRAVCETDATTVTLPPGEAPADVPSVSEDVPSVSEDLPSEASELLSESVRVVREKVEALREELGVLEGRLEVMEITESALREDLRREKERADREQERADQLHTELETERARRRQDLQESSGWLFKG